MLKVYFLEVERIGNTDRVKGTEYIHEAVLECTENPDVRRLLMDTTVEEDTALSALAIEIRTPTVEEQAKFEALPELAPPPRDLAAEVDSQKAEIDSLKARIKDLENK